MTERIKQLTETVISNYVDDKKSTMDIARSLKLNVKTVRRVLKNNRIVIRGSKRNLIGNTYGRLTVIKFLQLDNSQKCVWECRCECGNKKGIRGGDLTSKKVKSCGCLLSETSKENIKKSHRLYPKSAGFKGIGDLPGRYLSIIKHRSMRKKFEYSVSKEYLWNLFKKQDELCSLTKLPIKFSKKGNEQTASLDRIDSSKGYIEGNVQWLHKDVNNIKQDYSMDEFVRYCRLITENYK